MDGEMVERASARALARMYGLDGPSIGSYLDQKLSEFQEDMLLQLQQSYGYCQRQRRTGAVYEKFR